MRVIEVALLINLILLSILILITFKLEDKIALLKRAHEILEIEVRDQNRSDK